VGIFVAVEPIPVLKKRLNVLQINWHKGKYEK
jgi:hypothetical protein